MPEFVEIVIVGFVPHGQLGPGHGGFGQRVFSGAVSPRLRVIFASPVSRVILFRVSLQLVFGEGAVVLLRDAEVRI